MGAVPTEHLHELNGSCIIDVVGIQAPALDRTLLVQYVKAVLGQFSFPAPKPASHEVSILTTSIYGEPASADARSRVDVIVRL